MTAAAGGLLIALVVIAGIGLMGWFVAFPVRTIFALYAASLPMASAIRLSVPFPAPFNTLSTLFGGLAIIAAVFHVVLKRSGRIPTVPIAFWFLFLSWATLTAFWASDAQSSQETLLVALPLLVLLALASIVPVEATDLDALRIGIILSGILVGAYALFFLLSGTQLPLHGKAQRFSLSADQTDPNILAASLLLPLALSIERVILGGFGWFGHRTWVLFGVTGMLLTLLAIIMTGSRGGLFAMVIVFILSLYLCSQLPGGRARVLRILLSMAVVTLVAVFLSVVSLLITPGGIIRSVMSSPPIERITENKADSSGRVEIWSVGLFACRTECAWGAGIGNFPETFNNLYPFAGLGRDVGQQRPAHNVYLSLVVETGLVGLTLFLLALAAEWRSLSRPALVRLTPSLRPALVGLMLASIFLSAVWFKYFWLVFVLIRVVEGVASHEPDTVGEDSESIRQPGLAGALSSKGGFS